MDTDRPPVPDVSNPVRPRPDGPRGILYVWSMVAVTAALLGVLGAALLGAGFGVPLTVAVLALAVPAAVQLAGTFIYLVLQAMLRSPQPLPELGPAATGAELAATCVVYPVIVYDAADVDALVATVRDCRAACGDGFAGHVALVDFGDAPAPVLAGDAPLRARIDAELDALRTDQGPPVAALYRRRRWNPAERTWMGWERKRGKLLEFTDLVAGSQATSFGMETTGDLAGVRLLRGVRFAITIDVGNRLLGDGARRLVAAIAHPANRAVVDGRTGSVASGFGFIRPSHQPARPRSVFEWAWQPYAAEGHGSFAQQVFGQDLFFGQGIFDVHAVRSALAGRIPDNTVLSHDKLEGMHAATGCADSAVLLEENLEDYLVFRQRSHRWVRGDVHLLPWIVTRGASGRRPLPLLGRWVLLSDLINHLWPPATLSMLMLGWLASPPDRAGWWTVAVLAMYLQAVVIGPLSVMVARLPNRPRGRAVWRWLAAQLRGRGRYALHMVRVELLRAPIWLVLLADRAVVATDAAVRALYRTVVSRRHILQWTSSARARRAIDRAVRTRWRHMGASSAVVVLLALLVSVVNPAALPWAAPLLTLWFFAPQVAYWSSLPLRGP